ncbi:NAD-dependent epimerase/dehydratase family protein [Dactylosporangium matsuzakiense]|uniref:ADP-L-glycero-D-manno-heptose-6-epimerase n=1 Tax=Dactylosporangium matsuzakiense TaxID=53360 RepID=A0A9W6KHD1_9ACTN|nr:NAD-dependent epimerase/dehydratase family protein [Dactylosporangium matsuzakiense]GLL02131.1 ADP-L-glycero-D-manno-heptose-6-epimerase [Dactylosporangium matsuzakiense]
MADRVLVTGAAGFIGGRVAEDLERHGWDVTAIDLRAAPGGRTLCGDYRGPELHDQVRSGRFSAVVHQAAVSDTLQMDRALLDAMNTSGALALAESALVGGATFLYASSFSVYGRIRHDSPVAEDDVHDDALCSGPLNPYAESKLALDRAMIDMTDRGLLWAGLRYTNVFAAGERLQGRASSIISQILTKAARGDRIDLFADTMRASRDYVPAATVCAAVRGLLDSDFTPGVYNLGSGHATSFGDLLGWCAEFGGGRPADVRLVDNPIPDRYQYWTCADVSKLRAALPGWAGADIDVVRGEAEAVFDHARRALAAE